MSDDRCPTCKRGPTPRETELLSLIRSWAEAERDSKLSRPGWQDASVTFDIVRAAMRQIAFGYAT